jgi:hypothetical protein
MAHKTQKAGVSRSKPKVRPTRGTARKSGSVVAAGKPVPKPGRLLDGVEAKCRPLVNARRNSHSALTLIGMTFTGWDVERDVNDDSDTPGLWSARKSRKSSATELRIIFKTKEEPRNSGFDDPIDGTLTITLTNAATTMDVPVKVDYADDTPPP